LHVGERRLILAGAEAVADDRDVVVDHRVEQRLEGRTQARERRVVDDDLRARRDGEDFVDGQQHVALV